MINPINADLGLLFLRVALAVVFLYHGGMKLFSPRIMAKGLQWKTWKIVLLGIVEVLGALSIALGVAAPLGALLLAVVLLGAIYHKVKKWKVPFASMNATGWEFDLVLLAASLAIVFGNVGAYALVP